MSLTRIAISHIVTTVLLSCLLHDAQAHESISYPYPISRDVVCRISGRNFCPGPCPRSLMRKDMTPNNPSITTQRGSWITVNILANNHRGGFSRWTLVNVRDMYNKQAHKENAFLFMCADSGETKCTRKNRKRDCRFDRRDLYFKHKMRIPSIYADGVYVLGWVWYGGGEFSGSFGDYYDCLFIKIEGGPVRQLYQPKFLPGKSITKVGGKCRSTVNRIGVCWREPCPGGGRMSVPLYPAEFSDGKSPSMIPRTRFLRPWRTKSRGSQSPWVTSMTIRSADSPGKIYASSLFSKSAYLYLRKNMRATVTCEVKGKVKFVTFYIDGREGRTDYIEPYTIAGDWFEYQFDGMQYAPWRMQIDRRVTVISCKAEGFDGTESWKTMDLST